MIPIRHRIRDRQAVKAFAESPEVMTRHVSEQLKAGAHKIARKAKLLASRRTIFGTLANSILVEELGALHFRVRTGANYARAVEEGTGPAAGRGRYMPNVESLRQYITHSRNMRGFKSWSRSEKKRRSQEREIRDRAWGLALHILDRGTKAQPFMAPAAESLRSELHRDIQRGVWNGIAESFGP